MKIKIPLSFKQRVVSWLLQPFMLAVPFAVVICLLMPDISNKYKIEFLNSILINPDSRIAYDDMDGDGWSDHYYTGYYIGKPFATVFRNHEVIDQRNYDGYYLYDELWSFTGDYNSDNFKEIYLFTYRNDSLFLNGLTFPELEHFPSKERFIVHLPGIIKRGYYIYSGLLIDLNKDGYKEVVANITAGYELTPRKLFAYDLVNDSIWWSPELGPGITAFHPFYNNGQPYFAFTEYASMNINDTAGKLHDKSVYFMILDKNLEFKFRPIEYKGAHQSFKMIPSQIGDSTYMVTYQSGDSMSENITVRIQDLEGRELHSRMYRRRATESFDVLAVQRSKSDINVIVQQNNSLELLDSKLELIKKAEFKTLGVTRYSELDVDNNGRKELLFYSNKQGEYILCRDDLEYPVKFQLKQTGNLKYAQVVLRGNNPPYLVMHVDNVFSTFQYGPNPWYIIRYPVWLAVYLIIFGFILLIRRMYRIQLQRKFAMQQKMTELKLLSIRNQMDPHFTFNVLNAIGSVILQNKPDESYSMLMKYSKLLRGTYSASDKIHRTLGEELTFVTNYLELQKMRYREHLKYRLVIAEDVDQDAVVPKMVLQSYIENAIKHGLLPKEGGGSLNIKISTDDGYITMVIKDDGIGRKKASELRTSDSGKGLSIMHDCYSMINRLNEKHIMEEFTDLHDKNGEPCGTMVTIKIPLNLSVSLS